jgi:hypothetical protein
MPERSTITLDRGGKVTEPTESAKFDAVVRKMMSVSHDEIVKREKEWKRKRQMAKKRRAKT